MSENLTPSRWRRLLGSPRYSGAWRPSLGRRLALVLMVTLALVGLEIFVWEYAAWQRNASGPHYAAGVTRAYADQIAPLPAAERPVALAALIRNLNLFRADSNGRWPGDVFAQLHSPEGQVLQETDARHRGALQALPPGSSMTRLDGRDYWAYRLDAPFGSLRVVEPLRTDGAWIRRNARQIGGYVLLAIPGVLIPTWLAMHLGLRPLRRLAAELKQRGADDLRPLALGLEQAELLPLEQAFDALLARQREQREREQAFIHEAAHEMRTPLAVVGAQAHVLQHAPDAAERERAAQALGAAIARASHLSAQLLTLASVEASAPARHGAGATVDLAELTRAQLAELWPLIEAQRFEVELDAPDRLAGRIGAAQWRSLLGNLIDNALRYCPPDSRIEIALRTEPDGIALSVADDGPGIAPADRPRVFERFWRADQTAASGTGLGLAIVQHIVRTHGGAIAVGAGIAGRGVAFVVTGLPVADGPVAAGAT